MIDIENERTQLRSRMVGGLRAEHAGEGMELVGWVHRRRNLGGLVFVDLRDRSGLLQVSFGPDWTDPLDGDAARARCRTVPAANHAATPPQTTPAARLTRTMTNTGISAV